MTRRALITGIRGFTGRYLAAELDRAGFEVYGLTHIGDRSDDRVISVDLLDAQGLRDAVARIQPQVVAHLAAIAFVAHEDVDSIYRTNVVGTRNLLHALARCASVPVDSGNVLLASSANIYGNTRTDPITEDTAPMPANDYAVSKLAMEYAAGLWTDRLPLTVVRPFNYTGVGQSKEFLLPKIVDHFARRVPAIELGNLDVERDFSDVRDVAGRYARLLGKPGSGAVLNICSGQCASLQEVIHLCSQITGHHLEVKVNPLFVRANEVKRLRGSRMAMDHAIGPMPQHDLETTLRWMLGAQQAPTGR